MERRGGGGTAKVARVKWGRTESLSTITLVCLVQRKIVVFISIGQVGKIVATVVTQTKHAGLVVVFGWRYNFWGHHATMCVHVVLYLGWSKSW